ncbi:UNVERIFIED_CONTAM: hypothetical protein NCL1_13613 [Trichonephila clavipes]
MTNPTSEIKPFGSFKSTIGIEDNKFMMDFCIIDNSQTTIDIIIETDVLNKLNLKLVQMAHNQSELKDNALEVLQLKLKNAEDKCRNLEMHVRLLTTFWILFRCVQLAFRMADCEENGFTRYCKPPLASPFQVAAKGSR